MTNTFNRLGERLRQLESVLLWEGQLDNARVRHLFSIQAVQASRLLREFADAHPHGVRRDAQRAAYVATGRFRPQHAQGDLQEYLALQDASSPIRAVVEDSRLELTLPDARVFSELVRACVERKPVTILYRSMSTPQGRLRLVYPHAVVRAGRRWHMRAWCFEREGFRDFAVTRVGSVRSAPEAPPMPPQEDRAWTTMAKVILVAHPALKKPQAELIEHEHLGGRNSRALEVRSCLVDYVLQDLRVAVDVQRHRPPEYQLAVANLAEIEPHLFSQAEN